MPVPHVLSRALAAKVGAGVEITLEAEDGTRVTFAATPEQVDELAEDLEEILDETPVIPRARHPKH